ncbi:MAG TPA: serine/threonine-protein kinase, partial [Phycisphaerae bacterium]
AYNIVRVLGEGGMGVVYAAEQQNPRRTVALKVIRPSLASAGVLRRFEHEAQLLGRLQHPGIAQIFEAGTFDAGHGRQPFFAMELVEGRPLLEYAAAQRLTTRARLGLVVKLCEAVQHAHQKGVIHRDLKPANILVVDPLIPQPKILDFGIARATDADVAAATLQTGVGQFVGTVQYMSPEQATGDSGQVDTRSDVYALGVVSFELLSGRLPHDLAGKTIPQALRIIAEHDPLPLSAGDRTLRGDLDAILAKALERDKARRYQSVSEFADDIERYLRDEPILARRPSAVYQLRKFARRHQATFAAALGAAAFLILGFMGTTWQALRATRQRDRAIRAETVAQQRLSEREVEAAKVKSINTFLLDMLKSADPATAPGREITVRQLVDRAAERSDATLAGQPQVETAVRQTLAEVYMSLGRHTEAVAQAQRAVELGGGASSSDAAALDARNVLAVALRQHGDYAESEALLSETLARCEAAFGAEHALTLDTMHSLAITLEARSRFDEAERLMRRTVEGREHLLGRMAPNTLSSINGLALLLQDRGRPGEAEPLFHQVIETRRQFAPPDDPQILTAQTNLAEVLRLQNRLEEAETLLRETLAAQRRVLGGEHVATVRTINGLAVVLNAQQRFDEAETLYRDAVAVLGRVLGERHPDRLVTMNNLAVVLRRSGKLAEAEQLYGEVLEALRASVGPKHANTLGVMANRAAVLADLGRIDEAQTLYQDSLAGFRELLGDDHPSTRLIAGKLQALQEARETPAPADH